MRIYQCRYILEALFVAGALMILLYNMPPVIHTGDETDEQADTILRPAQHQRDSVDTSRDEYDTLRGNTVLDDLLVPAPDSLDDDHYWSSKQQLLEDMVPPNVFYWWCGQRHFEFKHYISVLSIVRAIRPDKIVFHYESLPVIDRNQYHTWFEDIKRDIVFFEPRMMSPLMVRKFCGSDKKYNKMEVVLSKLNSVGGIYVSENTWFQQLPPQKRQVHMDLSLESAESGIDGYIMLKKDTMRPGVSLGEVKRNKSMTTRKGSCSAMRHLMTGMMGDCVIVKGGEYENIFPLNVIYQDNHYGRLVRRLFYGSEKIPQVKPTYDVLVPNIGHMIWIGGRPISYVFFLSALSMLYIVKVDVVYIHVDDPPSGQYWEALCALPRVRQRIKLITRMPPTSVYQGYIEPYYRALMSDIIRVDLMVKYGGVYTDTDAIWVKPLTKEERGYEAVATYDWVDWTKPFPDVVNFGVSYGKRNAPFWRVFRESMRVLHNDLHGFTGVAMPYKLLEKHPTLLRIDKRLGVICYYSKCHPLWVPNYHNGSNNHLTTNSIKNWREDVHAFHWTFPDPDELANHTMLKQSTGLFAEIGRFVLESAGLWDEPLKIV